MQIYKEFTFEAAHFLPGAPAEHANARVHGHSFRVRVTVTGTPDPRQGVILPFDNFSHALSTTQEKLDHHLLNDIEGLANPTLEYLALWLWNDLSARLSGLSEIAISRDSCHEGCIYRGP